MKTFLILKSIFFAFLITGALLVFLSSCATAPVEPLASGELRLLEMHPEGKDDIREDLPIKIVIKFEADGKPDIRTICFYWENKGPYFYKNLDIDYGPPGTIRTEIVARKGTSFSVTLETYVIYVREGKNQPSNTIQAHVRVRSE